MLFNSLGFLVFFTVIIFLYFSLPHRFRWILLLIASYWFYMSAKAEYGILLLISTLLGYFGAVWIGKTEDQIKRKWLLWASILGNLSLLLYFKYANFISDNISAAFKLMSIEFSPLMLKIVLPIGISFYTFQAISYTIDVYHKRIPAERHFGLYAVYHAFFPQLVAGPIERGGHLLPQFREEHSWSYGNLISGLWLMLWGFSKKIVIADNLAVVVNLIYNNPAAYEGWPLLLATLFFTFQIYCDFSGYSDIARGSAKVMGFDLVINFNRPFISRNIGEFWRRWHISLSSWFQDYVFTPFYLRVTRWKKIAPLDTGKRHALSFLIAIVIVEVLLGIWHGANWTFALFGLYHGLLIPAYYFGRKWWDRMPKFLQVSATFALINIGLLLFRSVTIADGGYILTHLFSGLGKGIFSFNLGFFLPGLLFYLGMIFFLVIAEEIIETKKAVQLFESSISARWAVSTFLIIVILLFGNFNKVQFIYFQF